MLTGAGMSRSNFLLLASWEHSNNGREVIHLTHFLFANVEVKDTPIPTERVRRTVSFELPPPTEATDADYQKWEAERKILWMLSLILKS